MSVLVGAFANTCICDDACECAPAAPAATPQVIVTTNESSSDSDDVAAAPATPPRKKKAVAKGKGAAVPVSPSGRWMNPRAPKITVHDGSDAKGRDAADPTNVEEEFAKLDAAASPDAQLPPVFVYSVPVEKLQKKLGTDPVYAIHTEHTATAKAVLDAALATQGGSALRFENWVYGEEITRVSAPSPPPRRHSQDRFLRDCVWRQEEMEAHITDVICEHRLQDKVWVRFSANKVSCTGAIKRSIHNTQEVGSTNRHVTTPAVPTTL